MEKRERKARVPFPLGQALVAPGNDGRAGDDNKRGGDGKEIERSLVERYEVQRAVIHCVGNIRFGCRAVLSACIRIELGE